MCHPVHWKVPVRAARRCLWASNPLWLSAPGKAVRNALRQLPGAWQSQSQGLGLFPVPLPSSQHFSLCPSLPSSPRSFCCDHHPHQAVETAPTQDTTCIICVEPVGDSTMVCPSCQHAWFHRACIQVGALPFPHPVGTAGAQQHQARLTLTLLVFLLQEQALRAGIYCFQCPLCRDRDWFIPDMLILGIRIPFRLVSISQLSRCEGTQAVLGKGLHWHNWPFAAINMGLSIIGNPERGLGWMGRDSMDTF